MATLDGGMERAPSLLWSIREGSRAAAAKAAASARPRKVNPEAAYKRKYDKTRIDVLRLLLAACSDPLFSPADEYNPLAWRWMSVAVTAGVPNAPEAVAGGVPEDEY